MIHEAMEGRCTYPSEASFRTGCDGGQCAGDGRRDPEDRSDFADPVYRVCEDARGRGGVKLFMKTQSVRGRGNAGLD